MNDDRELVPRDLYANARRGVNRAAQGLVLAGAELLLGASVSLRQRAERMQARRELAGVRDLGDLEELDE